MKRISLLLILVCLSLSRIAVADEITVPLFTKPPILNGKIDPAQWAQAARIDGLVAEGGKLERRAVRTYIGATETTLYIAIQSRLPDEGSLLATVDHDGLKVVYDDALEVFIDPSPELVDKACYQMLTNSLGHAGYQAHLHGKGTESPTWTGNWQQAQSQTDGFWTFECAIPIASMSQSGPGRKSTDGTWMINLCRDWRPDWAWTSFTGKYTWSGLTFRFVSEPAPIIHQIINGDPAYPQGGAALQLIVKNPSTTPMSLSASLDLVRNNMPEVKQQQTLTLAAGEEKSLTLALDANDPTTIFDLKATVTSSDGKRIYFARNLKWNKASTPNRWVTQKPKDASLVDLQFGYYPSKNHIRVMADISALPQGSAPTHVSAIVRDRLTHAEIKTAPFPLDGFTNGKQEIAFDLPPLNGLYEIVVQASGEKFKTIEAVKPFERKVFPWENLPVGHSSTVYAPFTPIEVQDKQLSTVLHKHDLNDLGLLDQIETTNANTGISKPILAAPMRYRVTIAGKETICDAEPMQKLEALADEAKFQGQFQAGSLTAKWEDQWDYDGTVRVALNLQPTHGEPIQDLTLEIPLKADIAKLIHANSDRIRSPIAQELPEGTGIVWDGSKVACDEFIKNFCPYIYLGDGNRGLCWFADNDRNWGWNPTTPNMDVVRQNDQVILRIHLINQSTTITTPRTLVYGLLAAPIKPRLNPTDNPNWSRYRFNRDAYRLLGTDINWFGNHSCGSVYPAGKDMYLWEMLARGSREKLSDDVIKSFADYGQKYFRDYGKDKVDLWIAHVNRNLRVNFNQNMIFYFNRASCPELEEFETFKDEWCLEDYRATSKSSARDEIKVVPSESYINYNLYWNARSFEVGNNKGVYWDNWFIAPSFNTEMTDAYKTPDGKIVPSAGIWAMREQAKRTFQMMNEKKVLPVIFPHVTSFSCLPMLSFATAQYDWEWKYSEGDVQDRFRRAYIQLNTDGELAGTWPVALHDQLALENDPWTQRTFAGVRLVHELDGYGGGDTATKMLKPVLAILQRPGTIAYHYWDDRPMPVSCSNADVPLLVYSNPNNEALIIACSYDSKDVTAHLDLNLKTLGLSSSIATDAETGAPINLESGQLTFPLKKHDVKIIQMQQRTTNGHE
jgi:hypothetical protein